MRIDHDQIFKTLIEHFFREFMELFFPDSAKLIDFSAVTFLREELFTDLQRGRKKLLDLVVKVKLKNGETRILLVHIEFESQRRPIDYPKRMFEYFCVLFLRYRSPIMSVAVFTDEKAWQEPVSDVFEMQFPEGTGLRFKYRILKLGDIDYRTFLGSNNPLAYALMARMKWSRREIVRLKADFLRLILGTGVDPARRSLLVDFIETYMPLASHELQEFREIVVEEEPYRGVQKMATVWELDGIKKGEQIGLEKGRMEAEVTTRQTTLIRIIRKRFGRVSKATIAKIETITECQRLDDLIDSVLDATQLSDIKI